MVLLGLFFLLVLRHFGFLFGWTEVFEVPLFFVTFLLAGSDVLRDSFQKRYRR